MTTLEKNGCCDVCKPSTLEKKAGLDTCRISTCGCHFHSLNTKIEYKHTCDGSKFLCDCLPTDTKTGDWEAEYNDRFVIQSNAGTGLLRYTDADKIKIFIRETHRQLLNELIAECERVKKDFEHTKEEDYYLGVRDGAGEALSDLKSLLENKRDVYGE